MRNPPKPKAKTTLKKPVPVEMPPMKNKPAKYAETTKKVMKKKSSRGR